MAQDHPGQAGGAVMGFLASACLVTWLATINPFLAMVVGIPLGMWLFMTSDAFH